MLQKDQLKNHGLKFAKSLQMVFKVVGIFTASHQGAAAPVEHSYNLLNFLLKNSPQLTLGFVDQRIMLNNILTTDLALAPLENECLKRGIGAVTFYAGMTLASYRRAVAVLAVNPKIIEEHGGLLPYLAAHPLENLRVFPAGKDQQRTGSGDTVLETDSESYLMSKALSDIQMSGADRFERLLQSSGLAGELGEGGAGPGRDTYGGPGGGGPGSGAPGGGALGNSGDPSAGSYGRGVALTTSVGGPADIIRMVESRLDSMMKDTGEEPHRAYLDLARMLRDIRPDMVLSAFSPQRQAELNSMPRDKMAAEVIEDTAVKWALQRLTNAPSGTDAVIVEEQVVKVLLRSLQATQMAGRLANKLADYVKDYSIPKHTIDRIQEELRWVGLTPKQKTQQLLGQTRFSGSEFRRMGELIKELLKQGHGDEASAIGKHYFETLDEGREIPTEDLSRIPDFLRSMAGVRTDFWPQAAARLTEELKREPFSQFRDLQVTNCLTTVTKTVAIYEDFELVLALGSAIERRLNSDPRLHKECCAPALRNLLNPSSVDRILEIFVQKHDASGWSKTAFTLLRWAGPTGAERVFRELEEQKTAAIRLALLRLISRIGPAAAEAARQRLSHQRWYVVRNACKVLADLKHPQLLEELAPVLRHAEGRVQQAALQAIIESRVPGRAAVFAETLPHLNPHLLEQTLDELMFLKDPGSLPGLEAFVTAQTTTPMGSQAKVLLKAVHALAAINDERSLKVLTGLLGKKDVDLIVRRAALAALKQSQLEIAQQLLAEFFALSPNDPLAAESMKVGAG